MKFFKRKKDAPPAPEADVAASESAAPQAEETSAPAPAEPSVDPSPAAAPVVQDSEPEVAEPLKPASEESKDGMFARLKRGLGRTSDNLVEGLGNLFLGRKEIDTDLLEELESQLLMADVGVDATVAIIDNLTQRVSRKELTSTDALQRALREELLAILKPCEQPLDMAGNKPYVILMVGVNGVGKTTTIGKLAKRFQAEGKSVMLAAGDTFRAAAVAPKPKGGSVPEMVEEARNRTLRMTEKLLGV